ncbi:MAG TPA: helix-turn-helix transcriptional regulator, partial [Vicinamibacterales bacterium]|nr:helix-turn-helix transcriptional regulator [Vicinamibacterales bacterium]
ASPACSHGRISLIYFEPNRQSVSMRLLPVREAAARLGVSYPTIKQWIYKGTLRTIRTAGGHHRIPEEEVERFLARHGAPRIAARPAARTRGLAALSGRNQLRAVVEDVRLEGLLAQVRLRVGDQQLTAVITRDAALELALRPGDPAVAVVKATEVMVGRLDEPKAVRPARRSRR